MCDAKIRPFSNDIELLCDIPEGKYKHEQHRAILKDHISPGSRTEVVWLETDRRNFRGNWSKCVYPEGCVLPSDHRGNHTG